MTHTNSAGALARDLPRRTAAEHLGLAASARDLWVRVLNAHPRAKRALLDSPLRHISYRLTKRDDRSDPLEKLARLLVAAAMAGYSEAALRQVPLFLEQTLNAVFAGRRRPLALLDREEQRYEAEENRLTMERHLGNVTVTGLDAEIATTHEIVAQLKLTRAGIVAAQAGQPALQ